MAGDVYYSASTDWTPPQVGDVGLQRSPGDTSADVSVERRRLADPPRGRPLPGGRAWQSVDLGPSSGSFVGTLAVPAGIANEQIRVVIQVVDGAGNVAWAANKGPGFAPTPPPPPARPSRCRR